VITGAHTIVFGRDADAARRFFGEALGFASVDAGDGWLIFALPPAELAVHPTNEEPKHELYLMCDDIESTLDDLAAKGVEVLAPVSNEGFGMMTRIRVPGAGEMGIYEPRHPIPSRD
jgi:catechol 2,3-dioxygenase-like lactoylglutathione lyase family enzyme